MKGYTVIIPTMWYHNEYLCKMVTQYNNSPKVKRILIIDNRNSARLIFDEAKVMVIGSGSNMFVNPSWNLGISKTNTDKIIIANDDILIENFYSLLELIDNYLRPGMVMGMDSSCFRAEERAWDVKLLQNICYGFGVFMSLYKTDYVPIPKEFKVWYGDNILFRKNDPFAISGVNIQTPMRGTSRKLNLNKERMSERLAFLNYHE